VATFSVEVEIRPAVGSEDGWTPGKGLVDTGAAFSQFPDPVLSSLGIVPDRRVPVILADGTRKDQAAACVAIRHGSRTAFTLVLFAGPSGCLFSEPMPSKGCVSQSTLYGDCSSPLAFCWPDSRQAWQRPCTARNDRARVGHMSWLRARGAVTPPASCSRRRHPRAPDQPGRR
jgi:hypothetical protein